VTLALLHRTFCRVLRPIRLAVRCDTDPAIEVVMVSSRWRFFVATSTNWRRSLPSHRCWRRHRVIESPIWEPRANAIGERVIGTSRRECLDRMIIFGRRHLEAALAEFLEHHNSRRPHCSRGQRAPCALDATSAPDTTPAPVGDVDLARLRRTDRLGGLTHECQMAA